MRYAPLLLLAISLTTLAEDPAPPPLRVMSYNIHHGAGDDNRIDLARIAKVITDAKPDIVAIQEVDLKTRRSGNVDQPEQLAKLTGLHAVFGKAMDYSGGAYGQVILSRWPIVEHKTHVLPGTPGREPRIALEARIRPTGLPGFTFITTHLDHLKDETDRIAQTNEINRLLARKDAAPTILAGDMNAAPDSKPILNLLEFWTDTATEKIPTCPADKPTVKIDWIFTLKTHPWRAASSKVIEEKEASDHRPILAEIHWPSDK